MKTPVYLLAGLVSAFLGAPLASADPGDGDVCDKRCQCEEKQGGEYKNGRCILPQKTSSSGALNYKVITSFYSPPGAGSSVSYGEASSIITRTETVVGSQTTYTVEGKAGLASAKLSGSTGFKFGDYTEETRVSGFGPEAVSEVDQPSHWEDIVYLWIRDGESQRGGPKMTINDDGRGTRTSLIHPAPGEPAHFTYFTLRELAGLTDNGAGGRNDELDLLSHEERESLLLLNPWYAALQAGAIGSIDEPLNLYEWDSKRFNPLPELVEVLGPGYPGSPGIYTNFMFNWDKTYGDIGGVSVGGAVEIMASAKVNFIVEVGVSYGTTFEVFYENVTEAGSGTQRHANARIGSPTRCWHQTFQPYYDAAFGSYAFVPVTPGSDDCSEYPEAFGRIVDARGQPAAGETVHLVFPDGRRVQTGTDANGIYRVYNATGQPSEVRARGNLRAVEVPRELSPMAPPL